MAEDPVREWLAMARKDFDETDRISAETERSVAGYARKQYIFDFIAEFHDSPGSSGFLRALSGLFPSSERVWWVVTLHTLRPPLPDPQHWQPSLADYGFLEFLLGQVESLDVSEEDFLALNHFPLVRIADDVLMSGAFFGCGMETVEEWRTPAFYDCLLAEDFPSSTARGLLPMARAEALIARILRILENHGLPRLRLGIGSATLYYGIRDVALQSAREDLIMWLVARSVGPYLLCMVRHGILLPRDGALVPNLERIRRLEERPAIMNGLLGPVRSNLFVKAIRSVEVFSTDGGYPVGDARVDECVASYVRWHESLGLFDADSKRRSRSRKP